MIKNTKVLALFFVSVFVLGLVFSFIPTQVSATTSGYVCSGDSSYDPREGTDYSGISDSTVYSAKKAQYITKYKHEWGVCKDGSQPVAPAANANASGYVCSGDSSYDPREGSSSMPSGIYSDTYGHSWGVCKDGSQPVAPAANAGPVVEVDNVIVNVDTCNSGFLGFPAWYRGLTNANCDVVSPSSETGGITLTSFIWRVVLNVIEMAMVAVAYVTVAFILYGGFQYLTSQGAPEAAAKARTTILNAVIGLVISLVAVGIITFISDRIL